MGQERPVRQPRRLQNCGGNWLAAQSPEDIARLGESLVFLTSQLQKLAEPALQARITALLEAVASYDPAQARPTGLLGLLAVLRSAEGRQSLGFLAELLKTLGKTAPPQGAAS